MRTSESQFINQLDKNRSRTILAKQETPLNEVERKLLERYRAYLDKSRINPEDFSDIYSKEEISKDLEDVEMMRKMDEGAKTEYAELLEGIVAQLAEMNEWFGHNAMMVTLSEYDDRKGHGDLVLEFNTDSGEIVRLLVDITSSIHKDTLEKKASMNFAAAKKENKIKYFASEADTDHTTALTEIPRVVIGISPSMIREACARIYTDGEKNQKDNYLQLIFLDELETQLAYLKNFSKVNNGEYHSMTTSIKKALLEIQKVQEEKKSLRAGFSKAKANADPVYSFLTR